MRALVLLVLLSSCVDYQVEPYAEYQMRDEDFVNSYEGTDYGGSTYSVGVRYVPPTRISYIAPGAAETMHARNHATAPSTTTVNLPKVEKPKTIVGDLTELAASGKDKDGNWTPWGAVVVMGLLLVWVVVKRPKP